MISVAAELAEMHPQTLRMYEQRGLISPKRSPKGTRLYSQDDVERLRRIQQMTVELGMNLAGVEAVLALEEELERTRHRVRQLERKAARLEAERDAALRTRTEVVVYTEPSRAVVRRGGRA
jgi:MerR family transcriptional regulator/heat shock protein HspR